MLFNATVTLTQVETRTSATKGDYTYAKGTLHKKDGSMRECITVMAFGVQRASVLDQLELGRRITINAVWDDHVLKILGPAKIYQRARRQKKTDGTSIILRRKAASPFPSMAQARFRRTASISRGAGDRSHRGILFPVTVLLTAVETRSSGTKGDYTYAKGRLFKRDGLLRPVTVMAFGRQRESVQEQLVDGRTIKVCATWDDHVLKVIGPVRSGAGVESSSPARVAQDFIRAA